MSAHLVLFARSPDAGRVKTRLQARFSPQQAARIYRAFLQDTVEKLRAVPADTRTICYAPADGEPALRALCGDSWTYRPQRDTDLGDRMHFAAQQSFDTGATRVLITGTDIPSLPAEHITRAFDHLASHDVVFGPSNDGGYYLVGLRRPCRALFKDIAWSTAQVFARSVARAESAGLSIALLPPWYDVDTPEELDFLAAHARTLARSGGPVLRHTLACLATL